MPTTPARTRCATTVSLDPVLFRTAEALDINVADACEQNFAAQIAGSGRQFWRTEVADALTSSSGHVANCGIPFLLYRRF